MNANSSLGSIVSRGEGFVQFENNTDRYLVDNEFVQLMIQK